MPEDTLTIAWTHRVDGSLMASTELAVMQIQPHPDGRPDWYIFRCLPWIGIAPRTGGSTGTIEEAKAKCEAMALRIHEAFDERNGAGNDFAARAEVQEAIGTVYDWYQSDEEHDRPIIDILGDMAADLMQDRADNIRIRDDLRYVTQDDLLNRTIPRIIDIAYTAFMTAKKSSESEPGEPSDWMNDGKPKAMVAIEQLRRRLLAETN